MQRFKEHPLIRAHWSVSNWLPAAAWEHVSEAHSQPLAWAHRSTARWPPLAAAADVLKFHAHHLLWPLVERPLVTYYVVVWRDCGGSRVSQSSTMVCMTKAEDPIDWN